MATLRQKKAVKILVGNGGNVTAAMREADYAEATVNTPQKLTESKGYKELMDEVLPDSFLAKKHKELLTTPIKRRVFIKGDLETETEELDTQAVKAGLDMAYKVKGSYSAEKHDVGGEGFAALASAIRGVLKKDE